MREGKQGVVVVDMARMPKTVTRGNPLTQLMAKFEELEIGFKTWLEKQPLAVEATVVTFTNAVQGAVIGGFMGTLTKDLNSITPPNSNPDALAAFQQAQALAGGPFTQARNFAVMTGVSAGINCVMKKLRGKEDVQNCMVASFGSGFMFSLVSGFRGPNQASTAISTGIAFALVQGGFYKIMEKFSHPQDDDTHYAKTRSMLTNLGLQNYEKNFKKGMLTDSTLSLLNDSALKDVKIPPGPRLLILDHIQRDPELKQKQGDH